MFIQSTLALGLLANTATAAIAECGTSGSGQALKDLSMKLRSEPLEVRKLRENVEIKTYIHVIAASEKEEDNYLSDESIQGQVDILNKYYNPLDFSFKVVKTNRVINESWTSPVGTPVEPSTEDDLRAALRQGSYKDLNLFFVRSMPPLGKCELPIPNPTKQDVINDGCIMRPGEPGEVPPNFTLTTVHEVGHWLGLDHTFENGCEYPGDYVDDTPYEADPFGFDGCPEKDRNTCPDKPGLDPIDNIMNYVSPHCERMRFTPGQTDRMHMLWKKVRANTEG
ncbi:hypothetical protein NW752_003264 [Fusarium irregulare]|uniref:Peptidase M43 pregnancy-associated plasma-A domain-containing protein n=1 Tax=Fusarium irregulare TaxID=2494466 RepID=A0A9W8UGI3_9HYPO|nr:hypothetical protein NW766_000954 [Fusarium irregulare]KAJ4025788.1 hypothetical protein NW752_003264 [Fusarium irregulare]